MINAKGDFNRNQYDNLKHYDINNTDPSDPARPPDHKNRNHSQGHHHVLQPQYPNGLLQTPNRHKNKHEEHTHYANHPRYTGISNHINRNQLEAAMGTPIVDTNRRRTETAEDVWPVPARITKGTSMNISCGGFKTMPDKGL